MIIKLHQLIQEHDPYGIRTGKCIMCVEKQKKERFTCGKTCEDKLIKILKKNNPDYDIQKIFKNGCVDV